MICRGLMFEKISVLNLLFSVITFLLLTVCPCYADIVGTTDRDFDPEFYEDYRTRNQKTLSFLITKLEKEKNKPNFDKNKHAELLSYMATLYKEDLFLIGVLLDNPEKYNLTEKHIKNLTNLRDEYIPEKLEYLKNYVIELGGDTKDFSRKLPVKSPLIATFVAMLVFSLAGLYFVRQKVSIV